MSIQLDYALYLREQLLKTKMSLAERGLLFTLLFRVGTNVYTWVSQKTLSIETDTNEKNVRNLMKKIESKGLIQIAKDPKDKRKLLYRPAEFLFNYHQNPNRKVTKNYVEISEDTGRKRPVLLQDTGRKRPVYTGRFRPVLSDKKNAQTRALPTLANDDIPPKEKDESNIKSKESRKPLSLFEPDEQNQTLCKDNQIDLKTELEKFKAIYAGKKTQETFKIWIYRAIEFKAKHKKPELKCVVKEMPREPEQQYEKGGKAYQKFREEMQLMGLLKQKRS